MQFEKDQGLERIGKRLGFVLAYFIFTTILFFILFFLNKLPETWTYIHIMGTTLGITIIGALLGRFL